MVLYRVYSEPYTINHYSTIISRATVFQCLAYVVVILVPFFLAYATNDFWQYTNTYREQPDVHFLNQWIVQIHTDSSPVPKTWSTFHGLNRLLQISESVLDNEVVIPLIRAREDDYNYDRVNDRLTLSITYEQLGYNVSAIQALLFFDVQFNSQSVVVLHSLVHISTSWSQPCSRVVILGDLGINQRDPLPPSGRLTTYNESLFDSSSLLAEDYHFDTILRTSHERNVTVMLSNTKTLWERGTSGNFTLQLEITYPTLSLTYTPGFWQVLKFAWIQYLSVLIILYVLVSWVRRFAFGNQIVPTIKKQPGITKQHTH